MTNETDDTDALILAALADAMSLSRAAAALWGDDAQDAMVDEECHEAIIAGHHLRRGRCDLRALLLECADAAIVCVSMLQRHGGLPLLQHKTQRLRMRVEDAHRTRAIAAGDTRDGCGAVSAPAWYRELAEWMLDSASPSARPGRESRLAAIEAAGTDLAPAGWRRAHLGVIAAILGSFRKHAPQACDPVLALLREGAPADDPRWTAAKAVAAKDVTDEWVSKVADAAWAATWAVEAAEAAWAVTWMAKAAAWVAKAASEALESSADRLIDAILAAIESEVAP
jgi:hypothetical protein